MRPGGNGAAVGLKPHSHIRHCESAWRGWGVHAHIKKAEPAAALETGPDVCARPPSFSSRMSCARSHTRDRGTAQRPGRACATGRGRESMACWRVAYQLVLVHRPPQPERAQLEDLILPTGVRRRGWGGERRRPRAGASRHVRGGGAWPSMRGAHGRVASSSNKPPPRSVELAWRYRAVHCMRAWA